MPRLMSASLALMAMLAVLPASAADPYPNRPIRIVVPFTAGGVVDSVARVVGEALSVRLGQAVIIENKGGAGGAIGTSYVAAAAPDGYTLLAVTPSHAVLPSIVKSANWNPATDFRAIAGVGTVPNIVVVPASSPIKSMAELISKAKASPGTVTYGTAGLGTSNHLAGELLAQMANIQLVHVPYKGQPEAVNDLLAGRIDLMPLTSLLAVPHIKSGELRGLAVTTAKRSIITPELPTVAEAGPLPGYDVGTWFGFVAPSKTPDAIVNRLSTEIAAVLASPEVRARLTNFGMEVAPETPQQFDRLVADEYLRWAKVMNRAGVIAQ